MKASEVKKVAIIGAGTIGASWAAFFAMKGLATHVYDINEAALKRCGEIVADSYQVLESKGLMTPAEIEESTARISYTLEIKDAVTDAQFIQENGPENYEAKRAILAEIEQYAPADALFSSSTSGLLITEIARDAAHPERCVGGHPYNPPYIMPLVEMTLGDNTSEDCLQSAKEFWEDLGKEPVVLRKESMGFIANRVQMAVTRECFDLVMRGVCTVEDVDKAVTFGLGLRWAIIGPNMIGHLNGGDGGVRAINKLVGPSVSLWLKDMATWTQFPPDGWEDTIPGGVEDELRNRPPEIGNDTPSLRKYRDDMLIEILKLHNKL